MKKKDYIGSFAKKELLFVTVKDPRMVMMTQEEVENGIKVTFDYSKYSKQNGIELSQTKEIE